MAHPVSAHETTKLTPDTSRAPSKASVPNSSARRCTGRPNGAGLVAGNSPARGAVRLAFDFDHSCRLEQFTTELINLRSLPEARPLRR